MVPKPYFLISDLNPDDVNYLDGQLLDSSTGRIKLLPASVYKAIDPIHLVAWGNLRARYVFPTTELIDWLRSMIGNRKAIEIGSGNGDLGYHLGIPMTDNYCQQTPFVQMLYALQRQVPTNPSPDVERLDAVDAIIKHRPHVVVGGYITQRAYLDDPVDGKSGNMFGPEEAVILERADIYIHIGNETTHGNKRIMIHPHETFQFDWLVTRSMYPDQNVIYVWDKAKR